MSTDFSIKPVGAPAPTPVAAPVSEAANKAVATELPTSQSVTAAEASLGARNDSPQPPSDFISHQAFVDSAAASIVFQVVDSRTDKVIEQFPDEVVLRRRAYFHTLDLTKSEPTRILATDRKA
jgi:hypothetical protein